jgi:hypothetical protein
MSDPRAVDPLSGPATGATDVPGTTDVPVGAAGVPASGGGSSAGASERARDKAQQVAGQAADQARERGQQVAEQARGRLRSQVDQRSTQAGEQVNRQVGDVRSVAAELRNQGKEGPAKIAEQAADRAERLGSYLRDADGDHILDDVEAFARRNPPAIVFGGLALGLLASRFLRASSRSRYETRSDTGRYDWRTPSAGTIEAPTGTLGTPSAGVSREPISGRPATAPEVPRDVNAEDALRRAPSDPGAGLR